MVLDHPPPVWARANGHGLRCRPQARRFHLVILCDYNP
jgi:hypothetical protein